uniref:endo-polygalacturonase n=1 Tax=Leptinotarsa decemlineata TaxID=7539 RepID=E7CIZ3_LEPDE|nr:endopolygalacturonase [Leptinotarsa decemlineata]
MCDTLKFFGILGFLVLTSAQPSLNQSASCTISKFSDVSAVLSRCTDIVVSNLTVPGGKILDLDLQSGSTVTFEGTTKFEHALWAGPLVRVKGEKVLVQGATGSVLDGQGALWWDGKGGSVAGKPYFFEIDVSGGSLFKNVFLLNCPHHCVIIASSDTTLTGWTIDNSDGDKHQLGHNTDGFDIINGQNIVITNSTVKNQDDCVAINRGSNMLISNLHCSGSHGLSLSVGFSKHSFSHNKVTNVTFRDSVIVNAGSGIHVKTHTDGGLGEIRNVTYENIYMAGITNSGINIQQDYANGGSTGILNNNIPITSLTLTNVTGHVVGKKALRVKIYCANEGCFDWKWSGVEVLGGRQKNQCTYEPEGFSC